MIRRFNYTGRKRLLRNNTRIFLQEGDGRLTFDADLQLDGYELPKDGLVFVEAYRQTSWMRFPFGTVAALTKPEDRFLTEFDSADEVRFRVRVTSPDSPRALLLAEAGQITLRRPEVREVKRAPLLPVRGADIGDEIWRVDFTHEPELLINSSVGDWKAVARNRAFISLVYPAVFREILSRILRVEEHRDVEDTQDWRSNWLRFATALPGVASNMPSEDDSEIDEWVADAAKAFCRQHRILEQFSAFWSSEGER